MAWKGESRRHSLARKGVKTAKGNTKQCNVDNPMNTRKNKELVFGHSLTHSRKYQKSVGVDNARCEHDRLVEIMMKRGMNHQSPFKSKLKASGKGREVNLPKTNLYLKGFDMDKNGNSIIKLSYPNSRGFSIQTNQNMPKTHSIKSKGIENLTETDLKTIKKEAIDYITNFGTENQKRGLRAY